MSEPASEGPSPSPADPAPAFRAPGVETAEAPAGFLPGVLRFFFVPLLLVGASLLVFAGLGALVSRGPPAPEDLVAAVASGGKNARWQAAQDLSNLVARGEVDLRGDERLVHAVAEAFRGARAEGDDARVVQHLAVLLGRAGNAEARAALEEALADGSPDVRIFAVAALAEAGDAGSSAAVAARLADLDPSVRALAAYAAGVLLERGADRRVADDLVRALADASVDVRWNAALGLARAGRPEGADLLWRMLHREYVRANLRTGDGAEVAGFLAPGGTDPETADQAETRIVRNALSAAWRLRDRSMVEGVRALAASDPDVGVRDWALRARDLLEREIADRGPVAARTWDASADR